VAESAPADWDAATYQRISQPQLAWGRAVVERLCLRGDEVVMDAGCGTGRVTRLVAEKLPGGRVVAVDGSAAMVEEATRQLADLGDQVHVELVDLLDLDMHEAVNVIVSTATFHWILDHDRLFRRLFAALRPGGRLVAQCGGWGNVARTLAAADEVAARYPYHEYLADLPPSWTFPDPDSTRERLERAGFVRVRTWLEATPAGIGTLDEATEFLATVVLRPHLEQLPAELHEPYARAVGELLADERGRVEVDYVRLNMEAARPEEGDGSR
jgi:trans-aconitate 2-methyltransferase